MKIISHCIILILLSISPLLSANDLIISDKLLIQYQPPSLIAHTQNSLIFKYKDWWFAHEILNPKSMYSKLDLSEHFPEFIESIFNDTLRKNLPHELEKLAKEQAQAHGIKDNNIEKIQIGNAKLLSVYDDQQKRGNIYIIEERMIHHLDSLSTKNEFNEIIKGIKER